MNDLEVNIVHDPADQQAADNLAGQLTTAMAQEIAEPENRPRVTTAAGYENLPAPKAFGALSVVLVLLPQPSRGGFTADETAAIRKFERDMQPDRRLFPVSLSSASDKPPAPLQEIVSFKVHRAGGMASLRVFVLNQLCLRMGSDRRKIFVSYCCKDGEGWAKRLAEGLRKRGYGVWRDEDPDPGRDDLPMISPGYKAQDTIEKAIADHGLVLIVDTMNAPLSHWVNEEINKGIAYHLPVLPVVIEDPNPTSDRKLDPVPKRRGGRFLALQSAQYEVRLDRSKNTSDPEHDLDDPFFTALEQEMAARLLENLRGRRRLIRDLRERFQKLGFPLKEVQENQLLFRATRSLDSDRTPDLSFRLLVQCTPYDALLQEHVANLNEHLDREARAKDQYAVLVHQARLSPTEKRRLLGHHGRHILVLEPEDLDDLGTLIHF